ncbi:MAG: hypothetical protein COC22_01200 [Flavobacteriaceae bacterium]|nr:MAG: hypothetical protein COC22_01200 [Flavobacteriaceae bacterium]
MMDPKRLPNRCLMDTGVLIRALRQREDADTADCTDFFEAMVTLGNTILIAAPTLAEVLRERPETVIPSTRHVVVVPFDRRAAEMLADKMPTATQRAQAAATNVSRSYIKYDAMIAACAGRWDAKVIIALDGDHRKLAPKVGLESRPPGSYRKAQLELTAIKGGK